MFIFWLSPNKKKKKVLEPGRLEYCVNGTWVYQARVPQKNFLITQIQLSNATVEN